MVLDRSFILELLRDDIAEFLAVGGSTWDPAHAVGYSACSRKMYIAYRRYKHHLMMRMSENIIRQLHAIMHHPVRITESTRELSTVMLELCELQHVIGGTITSGSNGMSLRSAIRRGNAIQVGRTSDDIWASSDDSLAFDTESWDSLSIPESSHID